MCSSWLPANHAVSCRGSADSIGATAHAHAVMSLLVTEQLGGLGHRREEEQRQIHPVISRTIMLHKAIPPARSDHWVGKPYSAGAAGRRRVIARIHRNTLPRNDVGQFKFIDAAPESHARLSAVWPPLIGRVSLRRLAGPIVTLWVIPFRGRARRKPPSIRTHPASIVHRVINALVIRAINALVIRWTPRTYSSQRMRPRRMADDGRSSASSPSMVGALPAAAYDMRGADRELHQLAGQ